MSVVDSHGQQCPLSHVQVHRLDARASVAAFAGAAVMGCCWCRNFEVTLAALFVAYLLYGLVRPG